jgi:hypothetical protein
MATAPALDLHDILLPDPVGLWPPSVLLWVLLAVVILLCGLTWRAFRPWVSRWKLRRQALKAWHLLLTADDQLKSTDSHQVSSATRQTATAAPHDNLVVAANRLLKNLLVARGETEVGSLSGQRWLAFLKSRLPPAEDKPLTDFVASLYRPAPVLDRDSLARAIPRWIRKLS